ncbi:MAG: hypothetical protein IOB84_03255 [Brevundimonas sp.]|nr:hypothetical protein [Brevundimonas sp.]
MTTISTKKQLLETAKILGIVGRHDMSKEQLLTAIAAKQATRTKKVNKSGNVPYQVKHYRLAAPRNIRSSFIKAPKQVKAIICALRIAGTPDGMTIKQIGKLATSLGFLKTKQDSYAIVCYYRRQLETFGLEVA